MLNGMRNIMFRGHRLKEAPGIVQRSISSESFQGMVRIKNPEKIKDIVLTRDANGNIILPETDGSGANHTLACSKIKDVNCPPGHSRVLGLFTSSSKPIIIEGNKITPHMISPTLLLTGKSQPQYFIPYPHRIYIKDSAIRVEENYYIEDRPEIKEYFQSIKD